MKQKPKTKLVHIGWCACYKHVFGPVCNTESEANAGQATSDPWYIDTVRVFAEVPVGRGKK